MADTKVIIIPEGKICDYIDGKFRNNTIITIPVPLCAAKPKTPAMRRTNFFTYSHTCCTNYSKYLFAPAVLCGCPAPLFPFR